MPRLLGKYECLFTFHRVESWAALGSIWLTSGIECIVLSTPTLQDDLVMTGSCVQCCLRL